MRKTLQCSEGISTGMSRGASVMGSAGLGRHQEAGGEAEGIESGHKQPKPASQHNTINVRHRMRNRFTGFAPHRLLDRRIQSELFIGTAVHMHSNLDVKK